jgi:hypothetical protein
MDDEKARGREEGRTRLILDDTPLAGGAPEAPDERWWSDIEKRHRVLRSAAVWAAIGAVAIGAGAAVTLIGSRLAGTDGGANTAGAPTATAPAAGEATNGAVTTATSNASAAAGATSAVAGTSAPAPAVVRAALVAYRIDGAMWVCGEAGQDPKRVFSAARGPFSLSPDGRTLAFVDAASKTLSLVDVASRAVVVIGAAELERPSWARDSSFVTYTVLEPRAHDTTVRRVTRDGGVRATLGTGAVPRVTPSGDIVAVSSARGSGGVPIVLFSGGGSRLIGRSITANAVAASTSTIVYCDAGSPGAGGTSREPAVGVMRYDGGGQRTLVKRPAAGGSAFFGEVDVTPDGRHVVYAESGDDGYSRIFTVAVSGGTPMRLSARRDAYPVGLSADGTQLFYIDGNALQGEATRLMAVGLDGTGRRIVVDGAGS